MYLLEVLFCGWHTHGCRLQINCGKMVRYFFPRKFGAAWFIVEFFVTFTDLKSGSKFYVGNFLSQMTKEFSSKCEGSSHMSHEKNT